MADNKTMGNDKFEITTAPTLVLGLGGIGKKVLVELKSYFLTHPISTENLTLLGIDTDSAEEVSRVGEQYVKVDEVLKLNNLDYLGFIDSGYDKYPEINSWLSQKIVDRISLGSFYKSNAEGDRQIGRLALFLSLNNSEKRIGEKLKDVLEDLKEKVQEGSYLNVFIVTSSGGGTGSAIFIDTAYILRKLLEDVKNINLVGIVLLPEILEDKVKLGDLNANTWAALKETDYFMNTIPRLKKFKTIRYFDPENHGRYKIKIVDCRVRPFDQIYLISNTLESGRKIKDLETVVKIVAKFISTVINNTINSKLVSSSSYVKAIKNIEKKTIYSSFGVVSVYIPIEEIKKWISAKFKNDYLSVLSIPKGKQSMKSSDLYDVEPVYLLEELQLKTKKALDLFDKSLKSIDKYGGGKDGFINLVKNLEFKLHEIIKTLTEKDLIKEKREKVIRVMNEIIEELLVTPEKFGIDDVMETLEKFSKTLNDWINDIVNDIKNLEDEESELKEKIEKEIIVLSEQEGDDQKYNNLVRRIKEYLEELRDISLKLELSRLMREFYQYIWSLSKDGIESLNHFKKTLKLEESDRKRRLMEIEEKLAFSDESSEISILIDMSDGNRRFRKGFLSKIYDDYEKFLKSEFYKFIFSEFGNLSEKIAKDVNSTRIITADKIMRIINEGSEAASRLLEDFTIDKWLKTYTDDAISLLKIAFELSFFMLKTRSAEIRTLNVMPEEGILINVEDRFSSSLRLREFTDALPLLKNAELVSTGTPYELNIVRMYHGFRIDDVDSSDEYKSAYNNRMRNFEPLHVFPEFNIDKNGKGREMIKLIAKAFKAGLFDYNNGVVFVEDEVLGSFDGKDLFEILWFLVNDDEKRVTLSDVIKSSQKSVGVGNILQKLRENIDDFVVELVVEELERRG